jgi:hypothetical protein
MALHFPGTNKEDNTFFCNVLLFRFTGKLLERANAEGINPIMEGDPEYFGFSQENVDRYDYYFLFVMNLPACAEKIWVQKMQIIWI